MYQACLIYKCPKWHANGLKWYRHGEGATVPWNGSTNSRRERVRAIGGGAAAWHQLSQPLWTAISGTSIPLGVGEAADLIGETRPPL
jgi:hypothetical protein